MRILIVTQYFWPEAFRINEFAVDLKERGHNVTVLTGLPNYPTGRFFNGYGLTGPYTETHAGIPVLRCPLIPRFDSRPWQLALNYVSFAVNSCLLAPFRCRGIFDLIFVYAPSPIMIALPAIVLKRLKGTPLFLWVQDLWPESLEATGAIRAPWILKLTGRVVRFIYSKCDRILVQSEAFIPQVRSLGGRPEQMVYFPNSAEKVYRPVDSDNASTPTLPAGFRVMFAGNIGVAQAFETILSAAERLKLHRDIQWIILGDGRQRNWVEAEVRRRELGATVHLLGRFPMEKMPDFFSQADAMLVTLQKEPIFAMTVPAKVQSYMACGRPVIAALDGEGARVVQHSGAGLTCPAEDPAALAETVLKAARMPESDRNAMGMQGYLYFKQNFENTRLLDQFDQLAQQALNGN